MPGCAVLSQLNLVVSDMAATLAFYRRLGWSIETPTGGHAVAELPNGLRLEFESRDFTAVWDSGYRGSTGGSTVLGLGVGSRRQVDALYTDLVAHGARERHLPVTRSGALATPSSRIRTAIRVGLTATP